MPDYESMARRQKALADFGEFALRSDNLLDVLTEACRLAAKALGTDLAGILEIEHDDQRLLVKAGVGWKHAIVGERRVAMGKRSSEVYAIHHAKPVIMQGLVEEDRFDLPSFMMEDGVAASVNAPIFLPGGKAYGLLQVDSREARDFGPEDIEFLRTYATILGPVIDRLCRVQDLQVALDTSQHRLTELQHRVKNHFGIITSLVRLRWREVEGEEARQELAMLGERIETLRLVHEQLCIEGRTDHLHLRPYITQLVERLCKARLDRSDMIRLDLVIEDLQVAPDLALPLGLILNEFITNSFKYAFEQGQGGIIAVSIEPLGRNRIRMRVSDNGRGLPPEPHVFMPGSGTGMRIIAGLARQIGAEPMWSSFSGTALSLDFTPT